MIDWVQKVWDKTGDAYPIPAFAATFLTKAFKPAKGASIMKTLTSTLASHRPLATHPNDHYEMVDAINAIFDYHESETLMPLYYRAMSDNISFGRATFRFHLKADYLFRYEKADDPEKELEGESPFIWELIRPDCWYPAPHEWAPREGVYKCKRPSFDVAKEHGLLISKRGKATKLGDGAFEIETGAPKQVDYMEYHDKDGIAYYVDGERVGERQHEYGDCLRWAGIGQSVPFFSAPGSLAVSGNPAMQAESVIWQVRDELAEYELFELLINSLSVIGIPRLHMVEGDSPSSLTNAGQEVDWSKLGPVLRSNAAEGEKWEWLEAGNSVRHLVNYQESLEKKIDDATFQPILRGSDPKAGVSATQYNSQLDVARAPHVRQSQSMDTLYQHIGRFAASLIKHKLGVPGETIKSSLYGIKGLVKLDAAQMKELQLLEVSSETALPNNNIALSLHKKQMAADGLGLDDDVLVLEGYRNPQKFYKKKLKEAITKKKLGDKIEAASAELDGRDLFSVKTPPSGPGSTPQGQPTNNPDVAAQARGRQIQLELAQMEGRPLAPTGA